MSYTFNLIDVGGYSKIKYFSDRDSGYLEGSNGLDLLKRELAYLQRKIANVENLIAMYPKLEQERSDFINKFQVIHKFVKKCYLSGKSEGVTINTLVCKEFDYLILPEWIEELIEDTIEECDKFMGRNE